jgi:SpoVK/Ycf46/Vps4 family AAA+-type ATPase
MDEKKIKKASTMEIIGQGYPISSTPTEKEMLELMDRIKHIMDRLAKEPKLAGVIESGPVVVDGVHLYRVSSGPSHFILQYTEDIMFRSGHEKLKQGTEVAIYHGSIVGVLPKEMEEKAKVDESFDLIGWDQIGGLNSQIEQIRKSIETPLKNAKLAKEFGLTPIKGMLLHGPSGCGKTLIARAIASMVIGSEKANKESFVYVKGAELLSKFIGDTEAKITSIFKNAREYYRRTGQRVFLFIDEAEALLPSRGSRKSSDIEATIVPTFLAEMDGFDDQSPFLLLASNLPNSIDSAILREGRIDLRIGIGRPKEKDVFDIFKIHLKGYLLFDSDVILASAGEDAMKNSPLMLTVSGAMIATICKIAAQNAMDRYLSSSEGSPSMKGIITDDIKSAVSIVEKN